MLFSVSRRATAALASTGIPNRQRLSTSTWYGLAAGLILSGPLAVAMLEPIDASASFPQGSGISQAQGFDTCVDPSASQMQAFYTATPYWWLGTYVGGSNMACSQPNLSANWLSTLYGQGWQFEFIWVGLQPPCTTYAHRFSSNTSTAFNQGKSEAISAVNTLILNLGVTNPAQYTALVFDLDAAPSSCQAATNAFINGWDYQLGTSPAQSYGVYGGVCSSSLQSYANITYVPAFVWGGLWDGNKSTKGLWDSTNNCGVTSGSWIYNQRLKQWKGPHNETWNGVTLNVDDDCANSWVDPSGTSYTDSACIA